MAVNDKQKIATPVNDANIKDLIDSYLVQGFVIISITNLAPVQNKLLIVYCTPPEI